MLHILTLMTKLFRTTNGFSRVSLNNSLTQYDNKYDR